MAKAVWLKQGSEKYYPAPYWPIGSIYISVVNTNPSQWFGGVWESFGSGKVLVGIDTSQTEFNTVMKTGGAKTHKLTVDEMPGHSHMFNRAPIYYHENKPGQTVAGSLANTFAEPVTYTESTGGSQAHNNLQPYITVYMWRRVS